MCMRPHTFEMPLQVLLTVFDQPEETVELLDVATVLTLKEWASEKYGIDVRYMRVMAAKKLDTPDGTVVLMNTLKNDVLLSSDSRFLKLRIVQECQDAMQGM